MATSHDNTTDNAACTSSTPVQFSHKPSPTTSTDAYIDHMEDAIASVEQAMEDTEAKINNLEGDLREAQRTMDALNRTKPAKSKSNKITKQRHILDELDCEIEEEKTKLVALVDKRDIYNEELQRSLEQRALAREVYHKDQADKQERRKKDEASKKQKQGVQFSQGEANSPDPNNNQPGASQPSNITPKDITEQHRDLRVTGLEQEMEKMMRMNGELTELINKNIRDQDRFREEMRNTAQQAERRQRETWEATRSEQSNTNQRRNQTSKDTPHSTRGQWRKVPLTTTEETQEEEEGGENDGNGTPRHREDSNTSDTSLTRHQKRSGRAFSNNIPCPAPFSGGPGEDPKDFVHELNTYLELRKIDDETGKFIKVKSLLEKNVRDIVFSLPREERQSYSQITEFLTDNWRGTVDVEVTRGDFETRTQKPGETLKDFWQNIKLLHDVGWRSKPHTESNRRDREKTLIKKFCAGLTNPVVKSKLNELFFPLWSTNPNQDADTIVRYAEIYTAQFPGPPIQAQRYCTICRQNGHAKATCPMRQTTPFRTIEVQQLEEGATEVETENTPGMEERLNIMREETKKAQKEELQNFAKTQEVKITMQIEEAKEEGRKAQHEILQRFILQQNKGNRWETKLEEVKEEGRKNNHELQQWLEVIQNNARECYKCWRQGHMAHNCPNAEDLNNRQRERDRRLDELEKRQQAFQQKVSNQLEEISSKLAMISLPKKKDPFL